MIELTDAASLVLVGAGVLFLAAGTVGLLRFPDALTRVHALTKADNLGLGLVVAGLMVRASWPWEALKLLAIWAFVMLSSAVAGQLLGRVIHRSGAPDGGLRR